MDREPENSVPRASSPQAGSVVLVVTPWNAFAAGALLASVLALAVVLGRKFPQTPEQTTNGNQFENAGLLDEVRGQRPFRYDELKVDRGTAD